MIGWSVRLRARACATAVAVGQKLYCFTRRYFKVHVFNTVSLRWRTLPPVKMNGGGILVLSVSMYWGSALLIEDIVYFWGGKFGGKLLYAFDVDAHRWFKPQVSGSVPEWRRNHSACVLGKVMYVYGGCNMRTGGLNGTMYTLDTNTMVWTLINARGTLPDASYGHSATIIGTKIFVFGGIGDQQQLYNNIRVFDTETNLWLSIPSQQILPNVRRDHSVFTYNGELYIFGGRNNNQTFNDVWKFRPETFSWKKVEPKGTDQPTPRHSLNCCMVGDRIILLGNNSRTPNDNPCPNYTPNYLYVLDLSPSLKTLCKQAVIQYALDQSELPHGIKWELAAMGDRWWNDTDTYNTDTGFFTQCQ